MDPNATLRIVMDESADHEDRQIAAADLLEWINGGGFLPDTKLHVSTLIRQCERIAAVGHH